MAVDVHPSVTGAQGICNTKYAQHSDKYRVNGRFGGGVVNKSTRWPDQGLFIEVQQQKRPNPGAINLVQAHF